LFIFFSFFGNKKPLARRGFQNIIKKIISS
jgi:hypothetical protein